MTYTRQAIKLEGETQSSDSHRQTRTTAAFGGGWNFQHIAIFGHGPAGKLDTLVGNHAGNRIIAVRLASGLSSNNRLNHVTHSGGSLAVTFIGGK